MNLKEAFRYQSFLDKLITNARYSILDKEHALKTTKNHLKSKANPDATDLLETVEVPEFFPNDDVIAFMLWVITERERLTKAIVEAKNSLDFCFDAALEANKFRQLTNNAITSMLRYTAVKRVEQGRDYRFNVEGNQTPYFYEIETSLEENFNRSEAKTIARKLIETADETSMKLDSATINTIVNYEPVFNVNDSFEDVMTEFIDNIKPTLK